MSHTQVQYLKKQIERRDGQIHVLMTAFENLAAENEYLASVACGFAWDLAETMSDSDVPVVKAMLMEWDEAVAAAEKQNAETK